MAPAKTATSILNSNGEKGHLCLGPDLGENAPSFLLFNMIVAVDLSYIALIFPVMHNIHSQYNKYACEI